MSNIVEYIVKIRDLASGQWRSFANAGEGAFNRLNNRMRSTGSSIDQLNAKISALEKTRNISVNTSDIARANREIESLEKRRDRLENKGRSGRGGMSWLRQGLAIAGIGSMALVGKEIMQSGMERQMNQVAFQTLLGKKDGSALNGQLLNFAKQSIYGNEVFTEGKLMAGSGVKAGNIMPVMSMIGDIAMGDKERMKSLALAFSEANTRGSLNGMNERMFLQGGLFNPLEQLHKMNGKSLPELKKDMAQGKISIDMLVKAMEYATGPAGRWHDMMKKMQETPAGKWTAFTGTVRTLAGTIGLSLLPVLGGLTDLLTRLINNTPALYGIAAGIGVMAGAWALYTLYTERAAIWQGILEAIAYWPLALLGATAGVITYLCVKYDNWGKSMTQVWGIAKNVGLGIYDIFKFAVDDIGTLFDILGLKIKATFEFVTSMMSNVGKAFKLAANGDFMQAGRALLAPIKTEAGTRADQLGKAYDLQHAAHTATLQKLFSASQLKGLDFSIKGSGKSNKSVLNDLLGAVTGNKYTPTSGTPPAGVADTASGITGGGVRNQTINIQKLGTDTITIHTTNLKEGTAEIQRLFIDLFNQVINSGNAAVSPQ